MNRKHIAKEHRKYFEKEYNYFLDVRENGVAIGEPIHFNKFSDIPNWQTHAGFVKNSERDLVVMGILSDTAKSHGLSVGLAAALFQKKLKIRGDYEINLKKVTRDGDTGIEATFYRATNTPRVRNWLRDKSTRPHGTFLKPQNALNPRLNQSRVGPKELRKNILPKFLNILNHFHPGSYEAMEVLSFDNVLDPTATQQVIMIPFRKANHDLVGYLDNNGEYYIEGLTQEKLTEFLTNSDFEVENVLI